jgi:hypothetical protein
MEQCGTAHTRQLSPWSTGTRLSRESLYPYKEELNKDYLVNIGVMSRAVGARTEPPTANTVDMESVLALAGAS